MVEAVDRSNPEEIYPSIWRASQLARGIGRTIDTGYAALSAGLPSEGWPLGALIEFLPQRSGVGELRLLQLALASLGKQSIGLVHPPNPLNGPGLASIGLPLDSVVQMRAAKMADRLWAAEQVLRTGSFGALLLWLNQVPQASLRRLHLAAQSSWDTLFVVFRPEWAAAQASPTTIRIGLQPVEEGLAINILKRRGPAAAAPLSVAVPQTSMLSHYRRAARRAPLAIIARDADAPVAA
ncbi:translesion DNA synthesis-associated protein ImuA [Paraburkholderia sp. SARCC-3016]|uniref:translesion DNA synthesis-associated protein ImuA n=1 Tax=Paraburkholderia sp. SARCC-3016 TaxID=3058611 RepID=UPI0028083CCE|nr:translesion DNA synthesis-associated protein ImuA [Paraburkholderia sp. SARCC-3016]MDQ7982512.1 translesion DNA synthesis-associated protein ImuA [Paraburkholderia sp. SARCC-3016]